MSDPAPCMVLFDVDGTIFDSQDLIVGGFERAFQTLGYEPPTRSAILQTVGLSLPKAVATMRPDFDGATIEALTHAYMQMFKNKRETAAPVPFYEGMEALIRNLSKVPHIWLGVATGKSRRGLDAVFEAHGIAALFQIKQTADIYPSKPAPDMLVEAYERYGVAPERTVIIGDTSYDIEMGKNAATRTLAVSWGYHDLPTLQAAKPDGLVKSAEAIYEYLKNWGFI